MENTRPRKDRGPEDGRGGSRKTFWTAAWLWGREMKEPETISKNKLNFRTVLDSEKSREDSTGCSHVPHTQLPLLLHLTSACSLVVTSDLVWLWEESVKPSFTQISLAFALCPPGSQDPHQDGTSVSSASQVAGLWLLLRRLFWMTVVLWRTSQVLSVFCRLCPSWDLSDVSPQLDGGPGFH